MVPLQADVIYIPDAQTALRRRNAHRPPFHPVYVDITISRVCAIYLCKTLGLLLAEIEICSEHLLCWFAEQHVWRMCT